MYSGVYAFYNYIVWSFFGAVYSLSYLFPRNSKLWVVSSDDGRAFVGNGKYLFLHAHGTSTDVRVIWLSKDRNIANQLREEGFEAYYSLSLTGLYFLLRSKYIFATHGIDVPWWGTGGAEIVQFWHGNALKTIGWDNIEPGDFSTLTKFLYRYVYWNWDQLTLTSDELGGTRVQQGFRMDDDEVIVTGYPRNDVLFNSIPGEEIGVDSEVLEKLKSISSSSTIFAYVPTFRRGYGDYQGESLADVEIDFGELNDVLEDSDSYLMFKLHPHSEIDIESSNHDRILNVKSGTDVYPLLRYTDCLITDYSSVYFDFLLLDRPTIFFPYDLETYLEDRNIYFDYEEITPGPKVMQAEELFSEIRAVADGEDNYQSARKEVRDLFHDYIDGNSAERVFKRFHDKTKTDVSR
jgi:CDP-glycerol glycerophosphotransferase (TagB/SpsB family)